MEALRFNGSGSEYFKIWIVNILLTIITLGIYYPWAKVRNRRYFYANATLSGRSFEYHATGKQLFIGFLIGAVFFILYSTLLRASPALSGMFSLLFMLALPWLIWRSLMFNMKVTSFSNVHFAFRGKLGRVYTLFLGYPILFFLMIFLIGVVTSLFAPIIQTVDRSILGVVVFILGFGSMFVYLYFFAFIKKNSTEYFMGNTHYGQGVFTTNLETKKFFTIILKTIGVFLIPIIVIILVAGIFGKGINHLNSISSGGMPFGVELFLIVAYFATIFGVMSYMVTRERTYTYDNILLDNKISFESTLRARDLAWVMASNMFVMLLTLGLAFPWAKVRMARLMLENTLVDTEVGFDEYISQKQQEVSALGDQIGDAFDIDVGIAL